MFDNFSKINYKLSGKTLEFTDIFKSIKINTENSTDINTKTISGSRPDQFSNLIYNDPKLFWVTLLLNNIKNPFTEWSGSVTAKTQQNEQNYDTKIFQFANTSKYLSGNTFNFNENELDSYSGIDLSNIQQDDIILFQTGSGSFELKTYGAGEISTNTGCGYPHFGQAAIPDNFLNRNNITQISCGKNITACLDDLGYIWAWGEDVGLEASGFSLNGRLYRSATGQYKFIDTTKDKIVAINYSGDLQCFGNCADFTYTGQTNLVKTAWTSGNTLAGLAIKSDNTLQVFGPIVSTDSTAQYFSVVSCADDYCLGVITGANSNNKVVGFGSTGYFNQITQSLSYSNTINDLGTIPSTNPLYPFIDQNQKFLKQQNQGVLELKLKDLPPFTSPAGNGPEEAYRSDYHNVYAGLQEKILIGTTDIDAESREGFFINNPKLFAAPGFASEESLEFNYKTYYDQNCKPSKHYGLYDNLNFAGGITSIQDIQLAYGFMNFGYGYYDGALCPYFKSSDKNLKYTNSYFSGPYYYKNIDPIGDGIGITAIDIARFSLLGDIPLSGDSRQNYTIKNTALGYDFTGYQNGLPLSLTTNNKLKFTFNNKYTAFNSTGTEMANKQAVYLYNADGGFTAYTHDNNFWDNFSVKHLSTTGYRVFSVVAENGTPYNIRQIEDQYADLADLEPELERYRYAYRDLTPPAGVTFYKIENASWGAFWSCGIASDYRVHVWGVTLDIRDYFNQNNTNYFIVPGITAKDIKANADNIIILKNNQKINLVGGQGVNTDFTSTNWNWGAGFTVNNAVKFVGPDSVYQGQQGYVLTSDGKVKILAYTPPGQKAAADEWRNITKNIYPPNGITVGAFLLPCDDPKNQLMLDYAYDGLEGKDIDVWDKLNDGLVDDIYGNTVLWYIVRKNGEKLWSGDFTFNPMGIANTILANVILYYKQGKKFNKPLYPGDYWSDPIPGNTFNNDSLYYLGFFQSATPYKYNNIWSQDPSAWGTYKLWKTTTSANPSILNEESFVFNNDTFHGIAPKKYIQSIAVNNYNYWNFNNYTFADTRIGTSIAWGGFTLTTEKHNNNGMLWVYDKKLPVIICKSPLDYGFGGLKVNYDVKDAVLLDGCAVLMQDDKKITILEGDKTPFNNTSDLTNLTTENTLSFATQAQFDLWEQSLVTTLAIGDDIFCGYNPEYAETANKLKQWGNVSDRGTVPSATSYKQIDCFHSVCCGVKQDGLVECWGQDIWDITQIPTSVGVCDFVAVGRDHACAQNIFGNVVCWGGDNQYGQCDVPASVNDGTENKYLDCGDGFSVVCKNDNRIIAWGLGLTGPGFTKPFEGSSVPTELDLAS